MDGTFITKWTEDEYVQGFGGKRILGRTRSG
jgi:hypothetical protein